MSNKQKVQFWLNNRWEYLDADNADSLDALDSLDFASKSDGLKALNNCYMIMGNNDWTSLIYSDKQHCQYRNSYRGIAVTGRSRIIKVGTHIPIDPQATYEISITVKRIAGTGVFYCGVETLDNDFNVLRTDTASTYNYGVANSITLSNNVSQTFTGLFTGFNEPNQNNHNKFDPYGSYFDIVILTDNGAADDSGYYIIESLKIKEHIPVVSTAINGLMSAADKTKLNSLNNYSHPNDANTRHVTDSEKSTWSSKANGVHNHSVSNVDGLEARLQALENKTGGGGIMGTQFRTELIDVGKTNFTWALVKSFTHAKGGIVKISIPKGYQVQNVKLVVDGTIVYNAGADLFILDRIQDGTSSWAITANIVEFPFDNSFEFYISNTWDSRVLFQYYLNK